MTKLKLSSKMHIMIIVSAIIIAVGLAVGIVCQFVSNGYFNYGAEYSSYNTVVVDYALMDYGDGEEVMTICDGAFKSSGVKYYTSVKADTSEGGEIIFKFSKSVSTDSLKNAVSSINASFVNAEKSVLSRADFHELDTQLGGAKVYVYGAIAVASAIVLQFLYFAIRYRLSMAFSALLANVHNLAVYISLLAITRIPVGSVAVALGAVCVLMTIIGTCLLFGKYRKSLKDENFAKLDANEQADLCMGSNVFNVVLPICAVAVTAILLFVLLAISSLSLNIIVTPVVLALLSAIACVYGTLFFTPSIYPRFKRLGEKFTDKFFKSKTKKS